MTFPTLAEIFVLSETQTDMRKLAKTALALLDWYELKKRTEGDRGTAVRANNAIERISKVIDMDKVQQTHYALIMLAASEFSKEPQKNVSISNDDLSRLLLFSRHKLGLNVRGGVES